MRAITKFLKDKKGVSALEYAVLAGLIVIGVLAGSGVTNLKGKMSTVFTSVGNTLDNASNGT